MLKGSHEEPWRPRRPEEWESTAQPMLAKARQIYLWKILTVSEVADVVVAMSPTEVLTTTSDSSLPLATDEEVTVSGVVVIVTLPIEESSVVTSCAAELEESLIVVVLVASLVVTWRVVGSGAGVPLLVSLPLIGLGVASIPQAFAISPSLP